jgi:hypothetical protein
VTTYPLTSHLSPRSPPAPDFQIRLTSPRLRCSFRRLYGTATTESTPFTSWRKSTCIATYPWRERERERERTARARLRGRPSVSFKRRPFCAVSAHFKSVVVEPCTPSLLPSARLSEVGERVGIRVLELLMLKDRNCKRETKVSGALFFVQATVWKVRDGFDGHRRSYEIRTLLSNCFPPFLSFDSFFSTHALRSLRPSLENKPISWNAMMRSPTHVRDEVLPFFSDGSQRRLIPSYALSPFPPPRIRHDLGQGNDCEQIHLCHAGARCDLVFLLPATSSS